MSKYACSVCHFCVQMQYLVFPLQLFHKSFIFQTVKVWKRALSREEINRSMYNIGTSNSTVGKCYHTKEFYHASVVRFHLIIGYANMI